MVRNTLYTLKRMDPFPIAIYKESEVFDVVTGQRSLTRRKISIKRGIILPGNQLAFYKYIVTQLSNNKNFTYGGTVDVRDRQFIIDGKDLPSDFEPNKEDFIVWNRQRYDIATVEDLDFQMGYFITTRYVQGPSFYELLDGTLVDALEFADDYSNA